MSRRILKFVVDADSSTEMETADQPRFLFVDWQGENLCAWAEATVGVGVTHWLVPVPTGGDVPVGSEYVGSAQTHTFGLPLVFHVYVR